MNDRDETPKTATGRKKSSFTFLLGLVAGAVVGTVFGGGGFFNGLGPSSENAGDQKGPSVTFGVTATSSKGPASDAIARLLDSSNEGGLDRDREVLAFVDALKPGEFGARLNEAFARRKGNQGYDLIGKLYQKWVEKDRAAALAHAESLEGKDRKTALMTVLSAWAAKEPYEVLAWIEEHGKKDETQSALYTVFRTIAQKDPEEAIALAERSKQMKASGGNVLINGGSYGLMGMNTSFLYAIWAEKDPRAAAARALTIPNSQERSSALWTLASTWAQSDPGAAWEWGNALERASDRKAVLQNVISAVAGNGDTSQAIAFLETMPPGQGRSDALQQVASFLANSDPEEAYAFVMQHAVNDRDRQAVSNVLQQWARSDPARAFELAFSELDPGNARRSAIQSVINEAANRDPALARELMAKLDDQDLENVSHSAAYTLARNDLEGSIEWAEGLPEGDIKENAFSSILSEWSRENPEEAVLYGLKIENDDRRRRSLGNALSQWAYQDAVEAMTWAVKNLEKEDQENLIPQSLIGRWVDQDADAASEWVAALPEGSLRNRSVTSLISSWADDDFVAAGEWIKRLPKGESRDSAAQQYANEVFQTDPEAALAWAESIGDESNRLSQMESFARRYLRESPEKAKRWIAGSSLPQEKQEALLKDAPKR
ncbi:MAG: hypothetical protein KDN18_11670 [Verrucomicrobiae bacterium]|nr:hypothetical protein [Verrucomicrobiae bacterium]